MNNLRPRKIIQSITETRPDSARVTVQRDQPRVRTNYPTYALYLACALIAFGAVMGALAWNSAHGGAPRPVTVLTLFGLCFMLFGFLLSTYTLKGMRLRQRAENAGGRQHWRFDNPWDPKGADDGIGKRILNKVFAIGGITLFLIPFHLVMRDNLDAGSKWFFSLILGVFDLILICAACHAVYLLARRLVFGRSRVLFRQFPCYTGQTLRLTFAGGRRLAGREQLKAVLHCIREYYEWSGSGDDRTAKPIMESVWRKECSFSTNASGLAELAFELPPDVPGTDLIGDPKKKTPHYWELEITARLPGIDYEGIFLIPVYSAVET